jgi:hypothetical protein
VLESNPFLEVLDLSNTQTSDAGAKALAKALKSNTKLRELVLGVNGIGTCACARSQRLSRDERVRAGDAGAAALAEALETNGQLRRLQLSGNHIGSSGLSKLVGAVAKTNRLSLLELGGNRIRDDGAMMLASVVLGGGLRNLSLGIKFNEISDMHLEERLVVALQDRSEAALAPLAQFMGMTPQERMTFASEWEARMAAEYAKFDRMREQVKNMQASTAATSGDDRPAVTYEVTGWDTAEAERARLEFQAAVDAADVATQQAAATDEGGQLDADAALSPAHAGASRSDFVNELEAMTRRHEEEKRALLARSVPYRKSTALPAAPRRCHVRRNKPASPRGHKHGIRGGYAGGLVGSPPIGVTMARCAFAQVRPGMSASQSRADAS